MTLTGRINAAAAAIAAHTHALGIDDDNDPAGIGAWHLLYSLHAFCERNGMSPEDVIVSESTDPSEEKPFLVMVVRDGRFAPGAATAWEYEVPAGGLEEACEKAAAVPVRRIDAERRVRHEAYTDRYVSPDWNEYAGGAIIEEGKPDPKKGLELAVAMQWMPAAPPVAGEWIALLDEEDADRSRDPSACASLALNVYKRFTKEEGESRLGDVENLLRGLKEYLKRFGEDFDDMLADVRSERAFIEGSGADLSTVEAAGARP